MRKSLFLSCFLVSGVSSISPRVALTQLRPTNTPVAARLISEAFPLTSTHSWARALGIESKLESYMMGYLEKQLQLEVPSCWGASLSAGLDGVIICEHRNWEQEPPVTPALAASDYSAYGAIDGLLAACEVELYRGIRETPSLALALDLRLLAAKSRWGYISWIATNAEVRRSGLATAMVQRASLSLGAEGATFAAAYCVSPEATRVFLKEQYVKVGEIKYRNFEFAGQRPFASLPDEVSVLVKPLSQMGIDLIMKQLGSHRA